MIMLQRILTLVDQVLGDQVLGMYWHGSAVLGGLRPTSDLDVLVVTGRRMSEVERKSLVDGLLQVSGQRAERGPGRPVELSVVVIGDVKPWRYPPQQEFMYGEWLREAYEQGVVPQREHAPDLSVLLTMVLQGNAALMGPAPAQLLDSVPPEDLVRGAMAGIPQLLKDLESDTRNVLLTLARIWTTVGDRADPLERWGGGLGARARTPASSRSLGPSPRHVPAG